MLGQSEKAVCDSVTSGLDTIRDLINQRQAVQPFSDALFSAPHQRVAYIATGAYASSALTGALITKEASKVSAEGFIGGEFRHGPLETSGNGMLAVLMGKPGDETLEKLAAEMQANGTIVVTLAKPHMPDRHCFLFLKAANCSSSSAGLFISSTSPSNWQATTALLPVSSFTDRRSRWPYDR